MAHRYIVIDNASGYIWGDSADLNGRIWTGENADGSYDDSPAGYCRALDESLGEHGACYVEVPRFALASNETGYHVYRADTGGSEAVTLVTDGTDQEMIEAVQRDCEYLMTLQRVDDEDEAEGLAPIMEG